MSLSNPFGTAAAAAAAPIASGTKLEFGNQAVVVKTRPRFWKIGIIVPTFRRRTAWHLELENKCGGKTRPRSGRGEGGNCRHVSEAKFLELEWVSAMWWLNSRAVVFGGNWNYCTQVLGTRVYT